MQWKIICVIEYSILFPQCKEQSEAMLEKACITVENTAKGGGVYPEVLFQVAKYWYELYLRVSLTGVNGLIYYIYPLYYFFFI